MKKKKITGLPKSRWEKGGCQSNFQLKLMFKKYRTPVKGALKKMDLQVFGDHVCVENVQTVALRHLNFVSQIISNEVYD